MLKVCFCKPFFINFTCYNLLQMKIFTFTLIGLAIALIIFNITLLDFGNLMKGDSLIGLIGIAASFCAVFILLIFRMSKMIEEKTKNN